MPSATPRSSGARSESGADERRARRDLSDVITLIVPFIGPIFAFALYREGQVGHGAAVLTLAFVWATFLIVVVF